MQGDILPLPVQDIALFPGGLAVGKLERLVVATIRAYADRSLASPNLAARLGDELLLFGWPPSLTLRAEMVASGEWAARFGDDPVNGYPTPRYNFSLTDQDPQC